MSDMLSQSEIDALLNDDSDDGDIEEFAPEEKKTFVDPDLFSSTEADALGEIGNISMGTSATALFTLLGQRVNITTPQIVVLAWEDLKNNYSVPYVAVKVAYTEGLNSSNLLILKEDDVKIISDLMMGGDGTNIAGELSELHLSAISEAMNQMIGAAATSMSSMFNKKIDISPPSAFVIDFADDNPFTKGNDDVLVKVSFKMVIGNLIDSEIMQLLPISDAKALVTNLLSSSSLAEPSAPAVTESPEPPPAVFTAPSQPVDTAPPPQYAPPEQQYPPQGQPYAPPGQPYPPQGQPYPPQGQPYPPQGQPYPPQGQPYPPQGQPYPPPGQPYPGFGQQYGPAPYEISTQQQYAAPQYAAPPIQNAPPRQPVNVQPAQFESFGEYTGSGQSENISLIMDVPLEITVELGKTHKYIKDILEFAPGTVIELEKVAGEAVEILVNGKIVAKGEVVVINEIFGVRITDIVSPSKRL